MSRYQPVIKKKGNYIDNYIIPGDGIGDDKACQSTDIGKYRNMRIGRKEKTQANVFAANLLVPWSLIAELQKEGLNDSLKLAERLRVSPQAMQIGIEI